MMRIAPVRVTYMQNGNIKATLASGQFTYMVELVASAKTTEEKLAEIGAGLASIPGVVAGSVTSFAGGSAGHDPVTIAKIMKTQGLTPNVHLTCVSNPRDVAFGKVGRNACGGHSRRVHHHGRSSAGGQAEEGRSGAALRLRSGFRSVGRNG
ncbi:MAG: hypothetical protein WDO18_00040 [Acidobacteriota bacterium]